MATKTIQVLSGVGEIYAGERLLRTTGYRLELASGDDMNDGAPGSTTIEGTIDIANMAEAVILAAAQRLMLVIEDGRHVVFTLASSAGGIKVHGGLQGIIASPK